MAQQLVVRIVGDASKLEKEFKKASRSTDTFNRNMSNASRGAIAGSGAFAGLGRSVAFASGGFLGGVGLTAGIKSTVKASSDLTESINAVNVVFGDAAKTILDFSEHAVERAGLSMREFNQLATPVGALLQNTGDSAEEAAQKTIVLAQRAADMASVFNKPVAQALEAIQSALRGEADPIEVFGVKLNEAAVNAEVMRLGLANSKGAIDESAKAQARYALILQQTSRFQGDFANTSDEAANKTKIFKANVEDLQAEIGEGLIPALSDAVGLLNSLIELRDKGRDIPGGKFLFGTIFDQFKSFKNTTQDLLRDLRLLPEAARKAVQAPAGARGPVGLGPVGGPAGALGPVLVDLPTKEQLRERQARIRAAREAVREEAHERALISVDRAGLTKSVADDIAALQRLNALLARRIKGDHDVLANTREQISVQLQINALLEQQAQAREEAARKAREARDARQFRLLGLGPTGGELVPGVNNLKRQLASVMDAIEGSFLDTNKTRQRLRNIRKVLAEGIGNVSADVRRQIQQILGDLQNQLKRSSADLTRFSKNASGQLVLAGARGGGTGNITIQGGIHLHGVRTVEDIENQLAKRRKQRRRQRRSTR